jgi:hypothetical protein
MINCFSITNEIVVFECLGFHEDRPILHLLKPGEVNKRGNVSNIYSLSSGFMKFIAELSGFILDDFAIENFKALKPNEWSRITLSFKELKIKSLSIIGSLFH